MKSRSIRSRLILIFGSLIIFSLLLIGTVSNILADRSVTALTKMSLKNDVDAIYRTLDLAYRLSLQKQAGNIEVAGYHTRGMTLDNDKLIETEAIDQISRQGKTIKIPTMELNGIPIYQNNKLIRLINEQLDTTVTIYQKIDSGFLRISTNIMTNEGKLATGTYIPNSSPVAQSLEQGRDYVGRAYVVNGWYITAYRPIKDQSGKIIGAIYTGLN